MGDAEKSRGKLVVKKLALSSAARRSTFRQKSFFLLNLLGVKKGEEVWEEVC